METRCNKRKGIRTVECPIKGTCCQTQKTDKDKEENETDRERDRPESKKN